MLSTNEKVQYVSNGKDRKKIIISVHEVGLPLQV